MVGRPPLVAVRDGQARLLVRRESLDDIRSRDVGL
jgi:diaminopimelate decarboxylase